MPTKSSDDEMTNDEESIALWRKHRGEIVESFHKIKAPPKRWTVPFIPWCGKEYWNSSPRILFVGKSVGSSKDPDAKEWRTTVRQWKRSKTPDAIAITDRYMNEMVAEFRPRSPAFWLKVLLVAGALLPDTTEPETIVQSIARTNIYKVNNREKSNGVPTKADLKHKFPNGTCLLDQCAEWFKEEVRILRPDLVLLGVSSEWPQFAKALDIDASSDLELPSMLDEASLVQLELQYSPSGIWVTNHFTAWAQHKRNRRHGTIILDMRKAWRNSQQRCPMNSKSATARGEGRL